MTPLPRVAAPSFPDRPRIVTSEPDFDGDTMRGRRQAPAIMRCADGIVHGGTHRRRDGTALRCRFNDDDDVTWELDIKVSARGNEVRQLLYCKTRGIQKTNNKIKIKN